MLIWVFISQGHHTDGTPTRQHLMNSSPVIFCGFPLIRSRMVINKKRIRSLSANLNLVEPGQVIIPAVRVTEQIAGKLVRLGWGGNPEPGTTILPEAIGAISRFNAEGKYVVRKDLPKETKFRQIEWHWFEWHGKDRVEKSDIKDIPYERYPRDFIPPPSVELTLRLDEKNQLFIVADGEAYTPNNEKSLLHKINLFLELFRECEILKADMTSFVRSVTHRVNWEILPKGKMPWQSVSKALAPTIERAPNGNQAVIQIRFTTLQEHQPDFYAIGHGGFSGYVVFGFERLGLYILESIFHNNATYVLNKSWESISQMTKAEILDQNLHYARLIHRSGWVTQLRTLLEDCGSKAA
jgi:hypothetical protein